MTEAVWLEILKLVPEVLKLAVVPLAVLFGSLVGSLAGVYFTQRGAGARAKADRQHERVLRYEERRSNRLEECLVALAQRNNALLTLIAARAARGASVEDTEQAESRLRPLDDVVHSILTALMGYLDGDPHDQLLNFDMTANALVGKFAPGDDAKDSELLDDYLSAYADATATIRRLLNPADT